MASSNRPQFWLQVRKDYIFDNFESLLSYLRNYTYDIREDNPDYDTTLERMTELSEDFGAVIKSTPFYRPLELTHSTQEVIRLLCATILASNKAGITPYSIILSLIELLMRQNYPLAEDTLDSFYNNVVACVKGYKMNTAGFIWADIETPDYNMGLIPLKASKMRFHCVEEEQPSLYIENKGLLVFPPEGPIDISVVNRLNFKRGKYDEQFKLPGLARVLVAKGDNERTTDFDRAYQMTSRLLSSQNQFKNSPKITLLSYTRKDTFIVRITDKNGVRVVAETVDPRYTRIAGKVFLNLPPRRITNPFALNNMVKVGDFLEVQLSTEDDYTFETFDTFEDFYRDYAADCAGETRLAVFSNDYDKGTEWVTEDGIRVGIDHVNKYLKLDETTTRPVFDAAREDGFPITVRLYDSPPDIEKENFNVYAEPCALLEPIDEEEYFTIHQAEREMLWQFIDYCNEVGKKLDHGSTDEFEAADMERSRSLIPVLHRIISDGLSSSRARLEYVTALQMLCKICNRDEEFEFMEHERKFIYTEYLFAANRELTPLTHPTQLAEVEAVNQREEIVKTLMTYRKKKATKSSSRLVAAEANDLEKVNALVTASNNLIDIIDNIELNNIKQVIARALNIDDEYVSILDDRTYYGVESISLEFKTSVVFPPTNQRRIQSVVADPDLQRWAIIKAVCGFLNSRSGGELLIGVNDSGYAMGLDDDIRALYARRDISASDVDHYRTYLQKMMDRAFAERNGNASASDIAKSHIDFIPETNAEGKTIMRVKVKPYERDLIVLATPAADRAKGIEDSYVRLSGRTVVVTPQILEEIMKYKEL